MITDVVEFLPNLVITGIFYLFVYLLHIVPPAFLAIGIFYSYLYLHQGQEKLSTEKKVELLKNGLWL